MTIQTISETLFEQFCLNHELSCSKIPTSTIDTPDYKVERGSFLAIFEIKQLDSALGFGGPVHSRIPGEHIRSKIGQAKRQLQRASKLNLPGILVIYNNLDRAQAYGTENLDFFCAMHGEPTLYFSKETLEFSDPTHGKNRSFGEHSNTSFSALAHLKNICGNLEIRLYLNPHARHPLVKDSIPKCFQIIEP